MPLTSFESVYPCTGIVKFSLKSTDFLIFVTYLFSQICNFFITLHGSCLELRFRSCCSAVFLLSNDDKSLPVFPRSPSCL